MSGEELMRAGAVLGAVLGVASIRYGPRIAAWWRARQDRAPELDGASWAEHSAAWARRESIAARAGRRWGAWRRRTR